MPDFVDVAITTDPVTLTNNAIDQLEAILAANGFPGYESNEGNLEIIMLSVLAAMAADIATTATQVPSAIFRTFGTQLANLPYNQGAAATCQSTWTLLDTLGHTIPAGTYVTINNLGFYVQADVVVAPGANTATVTLVAAEQGTAYNNLSTPVAPLDQIDWLSTIAVIGATSGGADPEDDLAYQNRLAGQLALQAPRPITATDYAAFTLAVPSTIVPAGVVVGRTTAIDGYNPANATFTVTTVNTNPTVTVTAPPATGVTATPGAAITGTGIPPATTVLSSTATTITMSAAANASNSNVAATVGGSSGNARTVGVFVTDTAGIALSGTAMTAILSWLQGYRELNFVLSVNPPVYFPIYVAAQIHPLPGYDPAATAAAAQTAILNYLSPATWGTPATRSGPPWLNSATGFQIVRYNKLLGVIENVAGVDYVPGGSTGLAISLAPTPTTTTDLTMTAPAPLPTSVAANITVTSV